MKEFVEFRVNSEFSGLLFDESEGKFIGDSIILVKLSTNDSRYKLIPKIEKEVREKYNSSFFFSWRIIREYDKNELNSACLFTLNIKQVFEPCGEECGTYYDHTNECVFCGANRTMVGRLILNKKSIPKKDIVKTIAGEIVVSRRMADILSEIKGISLPPITYTQAFKITDHFQLVILPELSLSEETIAGINPFNFSGSEIIKDFSDPTKLNYNFRKEYYKCPLGHTIGLNLLSEVCVKKNDILSSYHLFISKEMIGVNRGFLKPEPILLCSPSFRNLVISENISGLDFELAHIT